MYKHIKKLLFLLVILFSSVLVGCNNTNNTNETDNQTEVSRLSADVNLTENNTVNEKTNKNENTTEDATKTENITKNATSEETLVTSCTTPMLDDTNSRVNNIQITCDLINGTVLQPGETFSYYDTVGKATSEKGYKDATVLDSKGNKIQGIGGGNCQVTSTMYSAILDITELEVVERHAHVKPVAYIGKDRDATVSYGSCDFKFKNNFDVPIKIYCSANNTQVVVSINKLSK